MPVADDVARLTARPLHPRLGLPQPALFADPHQLIDDFAPASAGHAPPAGALYYAQEFTVGIAEAAPEFDHHPPRIRRRSRPSSGDHFRSTGPADPARIY